MRRLFVVGLASALIATLALPALTDSGAFKLARVEVTSRAEAQYLLNHFDDTHNRGPGWIEVLLWPGHEERLSLGGWSYEVVVEDVVARDMEWRKAPKASIPLPGPDRDDYRRLPDYEDEMRQLAKKHPALVRLIELPHETLEGRTVLGLEIAHRVRARDGRPTLHIDGVHHAREWPAGEYPMIFAHHLVEGWRKRSPRVRRLLKRLRVTVVPVVNPDGFDYSREALVDVQGAPSLPLSLLGSEAYWRKNRRSLSGVTVPVVQKNPDAYGVDPNRNYAYLWGDDIGGSSGEPGFVMGDYRGTEPFSEPESRNIRDLVLGRNVTGLITNHTYGRLVLRPWGYTGEDSPDEKRMARLGTRMARAMGGYSNMKGIGLYAVTGATDDWSYGATGGFGYTLEHHDAFHPPYADAIGRDWRGVMQAFMIMGEAAADRRNHSLLRGRVLGRSGRPVNATLVLEKRFETPLWEGNPTGQDSIEEHFRATIKTGPNGRFRWSVNPSTRPAVLARGQRESYTLRIKTDEGTKRMRVRVGRGRVLDLGTISM